MVFKNLLRLRVFRTSPCVRTRTFINSNLSSSSSSSSGFPRISSHSSSSSSNHRTFPSSSNSSTQSHPSRAKHRDQRDNESEEDEWWEDSELDTKPKMGDGESGGGIVLNNLAWGDRALSIAVNALSPFGDDMKLFSLRASPREAIFVRLDKLSDKYGCPSLEDLNKYSHEIKRRLDEAAERGEIPDDLGVLVSTPGAERLMKIPEDLHRFKELPMRVCHKTMEDSKHIEKTQVLELDSIETEACSCVWKVANVRENRDLLGKGRPLTRKLKDWRLRLPYEEHISVSLYTP